MLKFEDFKKNLVLHNKYYGGKTDTKDNCGRVTDYEYDKDELNTTESYRCQCNKFGGSDKI